MYNLNVFKSGYLPMRYCGNWIGNIKMFFTNLKYAYQRCVRGYCDYDLFSMDRYIASLMYSSLKQFAEVTHSYPISFSSSSNSDSLLLNSHGVVEDDNGDAWRKYVVEIAEHFYNTSEDAINPLNTEKNDAFDYMYSFVEKSSFVKSETPDENGEEYYEISEEYSDKESYEGAMKKWLDLEKQAAEFRIEEKNKAFDMMKNCFFDLWD